MDFVSIDVETANPNMASICQIGIVEFVGGHEVRSDSIFVDPRTWFDPINISIHGIDEKAVRGSPTFGQIHDRLHEWTAGRTVVCHTHFDRTAVTQACKAAQRDALSCTWLDSARVARRAWPQFAQRGYGLANVAAHCGITFRHHDAREDARAAGLIILKAIEQSGRDLAEWVYRASRSISEGQSIRRLGDGDGSLVGEVIVFTGALTVPRREAADLAAKAGADVHPGVTKSTTVLVVGDQDISKLNGASKSGKHRKAETLITAGQPIRVIGETDFMTLASITE